ncbi:methyltransferase domain-containing protein [Acidobacteria bacterium AB60]|nr:methyltransferase domain-containing protein [Acidobacteria bacterium AB60]
MDDLSLIAPPPALASLAQETERLGFAMASEPLVGTLLRVLAASKPAGRILELGTGTGIATAWILSGMSSDATLVSVDNDPKVQAVAARVLGEDQRLQLVTADGLDFLARQSPQSFDMVFADAMPGKYEGLRLSLDLVKPGGFWIGDDLLPQPSWPEGHAAKVPRLLTELANDPQFTIVPLAWGSGVVIAVRRA